MINQSDGIDTMLNSGVSDTGPAVNREPSWYCNTAGVTFIKIKFTYSVHSVVQRNRLYRNT